MTKKATRVCDLTRRPDMEAVLFRVEPPVPYGDEGRVTDHLVASAINKSVRETYLFAADSGGEILDWGELDGSRKGTTDIIDTMLRAGYEVS